MVPTAQTDVSKEHAAQIVDARLRREGEPADAASVAAAVRKLETGATEPEPRTGVLQENFLDDPIAPFEVKTDGQSSYYIKLIDAQSGKIALTGYIRRGNTHMETEVPLGTYYMRYATGDFWYGETLDFGMQLGGRAGYAKCQPTLTFTAKESSVKGQSITLIQQVNGNMTTPEINPGSF